MQTELRDEAAISRFLVHCEALVKAATGGEDTVEGRGIEFVALTTPEGGECQICGHDMAEAVVVCRRCRTKHHEQCWKYYRSCSTFGCGEKRFSTSR